MSLLTKSKPEGEAPVKEKKPFLPVSKKAAQKPTGGKAGAIDYSRLPQVNLLPLEIIEKRNLKALQVKIAGYFVLFLILLIAVFAAVQFEKHIAQGRYDDAIKETQQLKTEEAKYAEVPLVLSQIGKSETAVRDGMYREVLWKDYIGAIGSTVPADGIIKSLTVDAAELNSPGPKEGDLLQGNSIGELSFVANLKSLPDTTAWAEKLESIPGLEDARFESATYFAPDGDLTYEFTGTVRLTEDAYSGRFEPKDVTEGDK